MDAGYFFLGPGEGFDRRKGLLAQLLGALDWLAGVRQPARQAPFAFRRGPVDLGLLPPAARFGALDPGFLAVEALRAHGQQRPRPLDGLQRALFQGLDGRTKRPPSRIEIPLPFVGLVLALADHGFTPVGFPLPFVGLALAVVSQGLAFVGLALAFVGQSRGFVGLELAFVGRKLALVSQGLALV